MPPRRAPLELLPPGGRKPRPGNRLVGEYAVTHADPAAADLAVLVVDAWQQRGLGRWLTQELADLARLDGIRAFTADVLAENTAAVRGLDQWPGARSDRDGHQLTYRLPLYPLRLTERRRPDAGGTSVALRVRP